MFTFNVKVKNDLYQKVKHAMTFGQHHSSCIADISEQYFHTRMWIFQQPLESSTSSNMQEFGSLSGISVDLN